MKEVLDALLRELHAEFPRFRIVRMRDSRLMRIADILVRVCTFNLYKRLLKSHVFAIGQTVYVPPIYDIAGNLTRVSMLTNLRVHMRECRKYTVFGAIALRFVRWVWNGITWLVH